MLLLDDSFIILKYNVFIDRAPCTKLHQREQKDITKTLPEFPNHVLKDYDENELSHFSVSSLTEFSHHCFLSFAMKATISDFVICDSNIALTPHPLTLKWNDDSRGELHNIFNNEEMNDQMDNIFIHSNDNEMMMINFI